MSNTSETIRWVGLAVSIITGTVSSLSTAFTVYAVPLKETFNFTQTQVELVASAGAIGLGMCFTLSVIHDKLGYKYCYLFSGVISPISCFLFYVAILYKDIFRNWVIVIALFQFLSSLSSSGLQLLLCQIGVHNFKKRHVGKLIGVYSSMMGLGRIFYAALYDTFFQGNLAGFFLTLGIMWIILYGLCFLFHRPNDGTEEIIPLCNEHKSADSKHCKPTRSANVFNGSSKNYTKGKIIKSSYFHLMFWSSVVFAGCNYTFLNNLTAMGYSAGQKNPLTFVYIISIAIVVSRILLGGLNDFFANEISRFGLIFFCYLCFMSSLLVGLFWFNINSVYVISILIGVSTAACSTLPLAMLTNRYGRQHYYLLAGAFSFCLSVFMTLFQLLTGLQYDENTRNANEFSCGGLHCFYSAFVMLILTSCLASSLQSSNLFIEVFITHGIV